MTRLIADLERRLEETEGAVVGARATALAEISAAIEAMARAKAEELGAVGADTAQETLIEFANEVRSGMHGAFMEHGRRLIAERLKGVTFQR